ncbi:outer membrane protein assembly factor BamB family protein [Streptomyces xanthophaeus]
MAHHPQPFPAEDSGLIPSPQRSRLLRAYGRRILAATAAAAFLLAGATACGGDPASSPAAKTSSPAPKEPFAPAQLAQAWKTPPADGNQLRLPYMASWRTDSAYYVGRGTGVEILDPATGKKLGSVVPPEPDMHPCAMTEDLTAEGLGAIAWIKGDPLHYKASCDRISLIDTRNGSKITWTKQINGAPLQGKPLTDDSARLAFVTGNVLAVMTPNTVVGLRPDGTEAWTWGNVGAGSDLYFANWDMTAHGDRLMVKVGTEGGPELWMFWIATIDASGRQVGAPLRMPVPSRGDVSLVGAAPMTAIITPGISDETTPPELVTFTRDGAEARRVPLPTSSGKVQLNRTSLLGYAERFDIAFSGSTAYIVVGDPYSSKTPTQIVALSLETGATTWTQPFDPLATARFLGADQDAVYVLGGTRSQDMPVYAYAAKDGTRTQISTVKAPEAAVSVRGVIVDYSAGNLALTDPGKGEFGTAMFRAPTP